jgi:3-oxoadipate CoA-transferase beta subunit
VLGAFQVAANGDLANWHTGAPDAIPAVGGAMDLAIGAKRIFVMMDHLGKDGQSKFLANCTYPLTGLGCVSRVYTDLATMELTDEGVKVLELVGDTTAERLQELTPVPLDFSLVTAASAAGF